MMKKQRYTTEQLKSTRYHLQEAYKQGKIKADEYKASLATLDKELKESGDSSNNVQEPAYFNEDDDFTALEALSKRVCAQCDYKGEDVDEYRAYGSNIIDRTITIRYDHEGRREETERTTWETDLANPMAEDLCNSCVTSYRRSLLQKGAISLLISLVLLALSLGLYDDSSINEYLYFLPAAVGIIFLFKAISTLVEGIFSLRRTLGDRLVIQMYRSDRPYDTYLTSAEVEGALHKTLYNLAVFSLLAGILFYFFQKPILQAFNHF